MTLSVKSLQTEHIQDLAQKIAKVREETIMHQLNDFISRNLISIEVIGGTFVRMEDSNNIEYRESLRLVLKDKEYIEKLEKENAELRAYKQEIKKLIGQNK